MKILFDECITKRLKMEFSEFEIYTVRELGIGGIKNGKLLDYCVLNHFDILLTIDKNMMFQQNLEKYPLTIVVLNSFTSKIEELKKFLPLFKSRLFDFEKYRVYKIDPEY